MAEAYDHEWRNFFTHDLPIPECFNAVCLKAHAWDAALLWILEEDVLPSRGGFARMFNAIKAGADVAVIDYPMPTLDGTRITWGVVRDGVGRMSWCRTGCILFKRECLDALPRPWFTLRGRLFKDGALQWQAQWQADEASESAYGADVEFTHSLIQLGFKIQEIDISCKHLRVIERGQSGVNSGSHHVEAIPEPEKMGLIPPRRKR
jgi:hypothetical protein